MLNVLALHIWKQLEQIFRVARTRFLVSMTWRAMEFAPLQLPLFSGPEAAAEPQIQRANGGIARELTPKFGLRHGLEESSCAPNAPKSGAKGA